ncbi:MAG: hypothetical protein WAU89_21795 [Candidatus Acidiferrales bacterium]
MLAKVVKALERTHVTTAALRPERVAAIISELNIAIRIIDNLKQSQFSVNPKIESSENSKPLAPDTEDTEELSENQKSELSEHLDHLEVTESDGEFSENPESEFSENSKRRKL